MVCEASARAWAARVGARLDGRDERFPGRDNTPAEAGALS